LETPRVNLRADFYSYDRPIELHPLHEERLFGLMTLAPANAGDLTQPDFRGLIDRIDTSLKTHLFDPAAYDEPGTRKFFRSLREAGRKSRDEAEFVMAWMLCSRQLTFSHCYVGRKLDPQFEERLSETAAIAPIVPSKDKAISVTGGEDIVTLRISSFEGDSYDGIDTAFDDVVTRNPRGLIIDLRDNPGGTYISGRVAAHLIEREISMGVFFNREARTRVLKGELGGFPSVRSIASEAEFNSLIRDHGAFVGVVDPVPPVYHGPVVVLTNARTASACEPLVAGLQENRRATIVGQRTAGSMLWTTGYDVGGGWMLWIPTVDYLTGKGVRLDGVGVGPDVESSSENAPQAARRCLSALLESSLTRRAR
jgi:hypothetical protein